MDPPMRTTVDGRARPGRTVANIGRVWREKKSARRNAGRSGYAGGLERAEVRLAAEEERDAARDLDVVRGLGILVALFGIEDVGLENHVVPDLSPDAPAVALGEPLDAPAERDHEIGRALDLVVAGNVAERPGRGADSGRDERVDAPTRAERVVDLAAVQPRVDVHTGAAE